MAEPGGGVRIEDGAMGGAGRGGKRERGARVRTIKEEKSGAKMA